MLIHAGGSGVGTAAVQLARLAGAVSIVTAGSAAKIDTAKSLGAAHGFNYKEENFAEKVLEVTDGTYPYRSLVAQNICCIVETVYLIFLTARSGSADRTHAYCSHHQSACVWSL